MKRNITILFVFILTGCLLSCEKDIEFKGEITEPLLVMNSIISPDSVISVHLSKSRFVLGETTEMPSIANAAVSVFVNGSLKEQLAYIENGIYKGTYFPKPGDEIRIEVMADGFDKASSQAVIPGRPAVAVTDSTVTIKEEEYTDPYQPNVVYKSTNRYFQLQLKLSDPADKDNYYYIKGYRKFYKDGELLTSQILELELSEVLKRNVSGGDDLMDELFGDEYYTDGIDNLFTDQFVNGKDILFDFSYIDLLGQYTTYVNGEKTEDWETSEEPMTAEYIIEIGEISKDLYQYVISGNKAENSNDTPFAEPVKVHSNIENGVGILGTYNTYRFRSQFETHLISYYY